jgi:RHS repeat-associated protein
MLASAVSFVSISTAIIISVTELPTGHNCATGCGQRNRNCRRWPLCCSPAIKFTGKERDWETGLDFFRARYYTAWEGRFGQVDPANAGAGIGSPQSFHGYAYVTNSPLVNTDPDGLEQMAIYTPRPAAPQLDISLIPWLLQGGGPISRETGTAPRKTAAAAPAPKKTGRLMSACTEKRIASGLTGIMNLAMATYKAPELVGSVAGLAATGVGAPAGALLGVYGTTSIFGQGLAGTAQLYSAFTGQYGTSARAEQVGNILSGPATGLGTLIMGGNMESAEKNAAVESMFTGGTAFVDGMAKEGASWVIGLADWSFGYLGTQDSGPNQCGKVP